MNARTAKQLLLSPAERTQLEAIAGSSNSSAALARRARIVLCLATEVSNTAVARRLRLSRPTVTLWRRRFLERGVAGLRDALRPGRPRSTSDERIAALLDAATFSRPDGKICWSRRSLAAHTGLSKTTVHRYLRLFAAHTVVDPDQQAK